MNKLGYTLVELITVIALISLITLITFPNLKSLMKGNNAKEFETYQTLMIEYTKVVPNYKNKRCITLDYLVNSIGLKKINATMNCVGYVTNNDNLLTPYLFCKDSSNKTLWKTDGYSSTYKCEE